MGLYEEWVRAGPWARGQIDTCIKETRSMEINLLDKKMKMDIKRQMKMAM